MLCGYKLHEQRKKPNRVKKNRKCEKYRKSNIILPAALEEILRALREKILLRPKKFLEYLTPTNARK